MLTAMRDSISRRALLLGLATAVVVGMAGCRKDDDHDHGAEGHGHGHEPKNGGQLVEIGSHQFNFELLADANAGKLTLWVLDAHAENYVRIPAPTLTVKASVDGGEKVLVLAAVANAASGEKVGDTSQFEGSADWLKTAKGFSGTVQAVTLRGQSFGDVAFTYKAK